MSGGAARVHEAPCPRRVPSCTENRDSHISTATVSISRPIDGKSRANVGAHAHLRASTIAASRSAGVAGGGRTSTAAAPFAPSFLPPPTALAAAAADDVDAAEAGGRSPTAHGLRK